MATFDPIQALVEGLRQPAFPSLSPQSGFIANPDNQDSNPLGSLISALLGINLSPGGMPPITMDGPGTDGFAGGGFGGGGFGLPQGTPPYFPAGAPNIALPEGPTQRENPDNMISRTINDMITTSPTGNVLQDVGRALTQPMGEYDTTISVISRALGESLAARRAEEIAQQQQRYENEINRRKVLNETETARAGTTSAESEAEARNRAAALAREKFDADQARRKREENRQEDTFSEGVREVLNGESDIKRVPGGFIVREEGTGKVSFVTDEQANEGELIIRDATKKQLDATAAGNEAAALELSQGRGNKAPKGNPPVSNSSLGVGQNFRDKAVGVAERVRKGVVDTFTGNTPAAIKRRKEAEERKLKEGMNNIDKMYDFLTRGEGADLGLPIGSQRF